jgi:hypothetical protein
MDLTLRLISFSDQLNQHNVLEHDASLRFVHSPDSVQRTLKKGIFNHLPDHVEANIQPLVVRMLSLGTTMYSTRQYSMSPRHTGRDPFSTRICLPTVRWRARLNPRRTIRPIPSHRRRNNSVLGRWPLLLLSLAICNRSPSIEL